MVLQDIREYVFPLFLGTDPGDLSPDEPIVLGDGSFLGSAFFIARNGIALAAAHCIPKPESLNGVTVLALLWNGERLHAQQLVAATFIPNSDVAILKIKMHQVKYLPLRFDEVPMGSDVVSIGLPQHSVSGAKEFRCLKGHVTFAPRHLELSFAAPKGMSGSPVLFDGRVAAVLTGNVRSESLEDFVEETTELAPGHTRTTRIETKAIINYGVAEPLRRLKTWHHEITGHRPFPEFIDSLNSNSSGDA